MKAASKIIILLIIFAIIFILVKKYFPKNILDIVPNNQTVSQNLPASSQNQANTSNQNISNLSAFQPPLTRAKERVTKKPFGIYITPATSPVQPEKFQGYHTGTDFEIFPEELNSEVPVKAICSGKLILKKYASGYGGVAVESCSLNNNPVTVIYGHLKLDSIGIKINDSLNAGETIGTLGADKSIETDGERKHLHLGMHRGSTINIKGYVNSKAELSNWLDVCQYVCF